MSAAGAGAAGPQVLGGGRPRYWIRRMNGRSAQIQAPDGSMTEVPTAHLPAGSAPGQPLDEQAFVAGHNQRQGLARGRSPFVQQLAGQGAPAAQGLASQAPGAVPMAPLPPVAPGAQGAGLFAPRQVTPSMMAPTGTGSITANAQTLPAGQGASQFGPRPVTPQMMIQPGTGPVTQNAQSASLASQAPTAQSPHPMPTGGAWGDQAHLDYFTKYGPGDSGLSQEQVNALIGKPNAAPNAATVDWNQKQQQFAGNNPGYATTGYLGNAAQVASQVAHGAQASGIPTGVLDSSFWQGGSNFGGAQTPDNTAPSNNGTTNWNDPSVAGFGVDKSLPPGVAGALDAARTAMGGSQAQATTGQIGSFLSSIPGYVQQARANPQPQPIQQAASSQFVGALAGSAPPNPQDYQAAGSVQAGTFNPGGPASSSVDYAATTPAIYTPPAPAAGSISGGGYTPGATSNATRLVDAPQTQPTTPKPAVQPIATTQPPAPTQPSATTDPTTANALTAFQKALANAQVAPSTGPAVESRTGRAHF